MFKPQNISQPRRGLLGATLLRPEKLLQGQVSCHPNFWPLIAAVQEQSVHHLPALKQGRPATSHVFTMKKNRGQKLNCKRI
jgi:hypothetical protein